MNTDLLAVVTTTQAAGYSEQVPAVTSQGKSLDDSFRSHLPALGVYRRITELQAPVEGSTGRCA